MPVLDDRSIEVLASGLPLHHGAQLAVDITLRSAVTSFGAACPSASRVDGVTLDRARLDKERKYHELLDGGRCHLVVVGLETGGRWSDEALHFIETLASSRARDMVPVLRRPAFLGWRRRWIRMLSISCSRAFASSLLSSRDDVWEGTDGATPDLAGLFGSLSCVAFRSCDRCFSSVLKRKHPFGPQRVEPPKSGAPKCAGQSRKNGAPKGGAPKGGGPEGWGAPKGGAPQNFALFSLSRHNFLSSFSLGVLSWNFGGV